MKCIKLHTPVRIIIPKTCSDKMSDESNPVCRVNMKPNAHHVQSTSGGGLEVDSNWIVLLFMIHARLCLPWNFWLACWLGLHLACGTCCIGSALAAMLGKKEVCFLMAEMSCTAR